MSAEAAVPETAKMSSVNADQNAQSSEDVKKILAELKEGAKTETKATEVAAEKSNGTAQGVDTSTDTREKDQEKPGKADEARSEKPRERRQRDDGRSSRGDRGGRGGYQSRSYKENIKSDLTTQKESRDPVAIRKQVEFYFSDSNLPMDKFLLSKVGGSNNNPVELKIIHSFKRMRHFQPFEAIVSALKESTILELTDDDTCVRRKDPLPESLNDGPDESTVKIFEDRAMPRSVYAKGFGEEVPSTQFDIEAFFAPYGPTNAIRLRRSDTKSFKGSVFVEFATEDLQKNFLAIDPKPLYKGKELSIMSKKEYCDGKVEDIKSGKIKANKKFERGGRDGRFSRDRQDGKRKRDDEDDRDWRERREEDRNNGFRNDRRPGHRSRGSMEAKGERVEKDARGVPVVKTSYESVAEAKAKRESATADALAKAKAMVEAEQKKSVDAATDAEKEQIQEDGPDSKGHAAQVIDAEPKPSDPASESKKRARDEGEEGDTGPPTKKLDTASNVVEEVNGPS